VITGAKNIVGCNEAREYSWQHCILDLYTLCDAYAVLPLNYPLTLFRVQIGLRYDREVVNVFFLFYCKRKQFKEFMLQSFPIFRTMLFLYMNGHK
jgi:hypothetical protein